MCSCVCVRVSCVHVCVHTTVERLEIDVLNLSDLDKTLQWPLFLVGEIRVLLVDFAVGINSCSHNIRKITPVLTEPPAPSAVTDLQLQVKKLFLSLE